MSRLVMRGVHRMGLGAVVMALSVGAFAQGTPQIAAQPDPEAARSESEPTQARLVTAASATTDPLFTALGGRAGIVAITDGLVTRASSDPKIGSFFAHTNLAELRKQLADHLCVVAGGPCVYEGASMKKAHLDLGIQRADFNRLVELLQLAMDAHDVPFADQNRLLARLAPMHRDVIEREPPPPLIR